MSEFHIHVNALSLSQTALSQLQRLSLCLRPFELSIPCTQFTPPIHLGLKLRNKVELERAFCDVKKVLASDGLFVGYAEGEYVEKNKVVSRESSTPRSDAVLQLHLRPAQSWRETEIHITVPVGSKLTDRLRESNFYFSRIKKGASAFDVATVQGSLAEIDALYEHAVSYCQLLADSTVEIKKEALVLAYASPGFNWLPPHVYSHAYLENAT